jgi:hypothetical protein
MIRKLPYSTTILGDKFGIDHARLRAKRRQKEQDPINEKVAVDLLKSANEVRKEFMYVVY